MSSCQKSATAWMSRLISRGMSQCLLSLISDVEVTGGVLWGTFAVESRDNMAVIMKSHCDFL